MMNKQYQVALRKSRSENPVKHLKWTFAEIVNRFQSSPYLDV